MATPFLASISAQCRSADFIRRLESRAIPYADLISLSRLSEKYPLLSEDKCLICSPPPFRFLPLTWKWHQPSPIRNPPAVSTHLTWTKPSHWSPSQKRELLRLSPASRTNITNILKLLFEFTEARYRFWKKWGRAERKTLQWKKLISFFLSPTPSMLKNSKISNVLFSIHTINKKETFP